jgi:hypothetical protein
MDAEATSTTSTLRDTTPKKWMIGNVEVVQDKLTFFEKNELIGIIAGTVDDTLARGGVGGLLSALAMSEQRDSLFQDGKLNIDNVADATRIVSLLLKLIGTAPEMLEDAYCVILSVNPVDRGGFRVLMREQMDDDTGFGIFDTFLDQNERTIRDFFERWSKQLRKAMAIGTKQRNGASPTSTG